MPKSHGSHAKFNFFVAPCEANGSIAHRLPWRGRMGCPRWFQRSLFSYRGKVGTLALGAMSGWVTTDVWTQLSGTSEHTNCLGCQDLDGHHFRVAWWYS